MIELINNYLKNKGIRKYKNHYYRVVYLEDCDDKKFNIYEGLFFKKISEFSTSNPKDIIKIEDKYKKSIDEKIEEFNFIKDITKKRKYKGHSYRFNIYLEFYIRLQIRFFGAWIDYFDFYRSAFRFRLKENHYKIDKLDIRQKINRAEELFKKHMDFKESKEYKKVLYKGINKNNIKYIVVPYFDIEDGLMYIIKEKDFVFWNIFYYQSKIFKRYSVEQLLEEYGYIYSSKNSKNNKNNKNNKNKNNKKSRTITEKEQRLFDIII